MDFSTTLLPALRSTFEDQPLAQSPTVYQALATYIEQQAQNLHRYPEEEYQALLKSISTQTGIDANHLFLGRTTHELFEYLIEIMVTTGDSVLVESNHPHYLAIQQQVEIRQGQVHDLAASANITPKLVFISQAAVETLTQQYPQTVIVTLNPNSLSQTPQCIDVFELPAGLSPVLPTMGICQNTEWVATMRKVVEPFHMPTHLLSCLQQLLPTLPIPQQTETPTSQFSLMDGVVEHIRSIQPYVPGKGIKAMARELDKPTSFFMKLASNEHPFGMSPQAIAQLKQILSSWQSQTPTYQRIAIQLKQAIVQGIHPIEPQASFNEDWINLGTGSLELIKAAIKAFVPPGGRVLSAKIPFAMYPFETLKSRGKYLYCDLETDYQLTLETLIAEIKAQDPHLIFLENPRNPLGTGLENLTPVVEALAPHQVLILDEAYNDFIRAEMNLQSFTDGLQLIHQYPNQKIISLRTFSKIHGLASFRLGYSIAQPALSQQLASVLIPCTVDPVSIAAGLACLSNPQVAQEVSETVQYVQHEKEKFYQLFDSLNLRYIRSYANFIYFETGDHYTSQSLFNRLVQDGLIIRPAQERAVRINIGRPEENQALMQSLKAIYSVSPSKAK